MLKIIRLTALVSCLLVFSPKFVNSPYPISKPLSSIKFANGTKDLDGMTCSSYPNTNIQINHNYSSFTSSVSIYSTPFTSSSHLVMLKMRNSFSPNSGQKLDTGSISLLLHRYSYSESASLTYYGGVPYLLDSFPLESTVTHSYGSSISVGDSLLIENSASFSLSEDKWGLTIGKKNSSTFFVNYETFSNFDTAEPKIYFETFGSSDHYNLGIKWTFDYAAPIDYGHVLDTYILFELGNRTVGGDTDNRFTIEFSTDTTTMDNRWFFPSTHEDKDSESYYKPIYFNY